MVTNTTAATPFATKGITVTGDTIVANGYNYGIYLEDYDPVTAAFPTAPLTVSGTGCVMAEGRSILGGGVSAPIMFTIAPATPGMRLSNRTATYTRNAVTVNAPTVSGISADDVPTGQVSVLYYTSYTDAQQFTLTTPANSGAASNGAAPVKAGTYYAVATLTADGNYAAASVKATVKINIRAITATMVSEIVDSLTYNGQEQTPVPAIHHNQNLNSALLTPCSVADVGHIHGEGCNGDYYLTYENNTNAYLIVSGVPVIGSVTVHGTGNYKETVTKSFIIQPYNITANDAILSVDGGDYLEVNLSNVAITDALHD